MIPHILLVICLAVASQCLAQTTASSLQRVAWPLADFVVIGDSAHGVQLLASPNLRSDMGRNGMPTTTLTLDPLVAHRWATGIAKILDSVSQLPARDRTVFETVPLVTNLGQGHILVAFDGKGSRRQPFAFVVRDAANAWWLPVSNADLQVLLGALNTIARESALSPSPVSESDPHLVCQLDTPPSPLDTIRLRHPDHGRFAGRDGRVLARYIIDTSGVVPPASIQILLSDDNDFTREVQRALQRATYEPGRAGGRSVDTIVWQWFVFKIVR